jgi:hypothetical protein
MSNTSSPSDTRSASSPLEKKVVPEQQADDKGRRGVEPPELDPTRYGDWEKNGRCIDF